MLENSALAFAGDLFVKGATAVVLIVAARELTIAQFALFAAAFAAAAVLAAVFDMGAQTLLTRDGVASPQARGVLVRALIESRLPLVAAVMGAGVLAGLAFGQLAVAGLTVCLGVLGAGQMLLTGILRSAQNLFPEAALKLAAGVLTLIGCAFCMAFDRSAVGFLAALALAAVLALAPMAKLTGALLSRGPRLSPWTAARRSLPLGVMALAIMAYYRSGTIVLKVLSTPAQTARFATASTVAFALLMASNAITTGLLPKLAASDVAAHPELVRRAALWALAILVVLSGAVFALARPLLVLMFGARYASAAGALQILALATPLIGPAGVLGTALVAQGRLRPISFQVAASLAVNLIVLFLLAPVDGAEGAALATLSCEALALAIMTHAAARALPGLTARRPGRSSAEVARPARILPTGWPPHVG
jgi:O-antigen/teichoic acid export membrane protein